jgi:hypothetical protein
MVAISTLKKRIEGAEARLNPPPPRPAFVVSAATAEQLERMHTEIDEYRRRVPGGDDALVVDLVSYLDDPEPYMERIILAEK